MTIKQQLTVQLKKALQELDLSDIQPQVDYPADPNHGDYSSNVALVAAKKLRKSPMEVGEEIAAKLRIENGELRVAVVMPGFINFFLSNDFLVEQVEKQDLVSLKEINNGKRVVIEYSSPNIAKPFTVGHLRSTIIGDAIANLLQATGWEVYRDNHVGDWGTQFGKQIAALKYIDLETGEVDLHATSILRKNINQIENADRPVTLLVDLYVKFHKAAEENPNLDDVARAAFASLEEGDDEARDLWQKCIDWSWKEFEEIYRQLAVPSCKGFAFENNGRGYGEAFFEKKMTFVLNELKEKSLLEEGREGAKVVKFPEETKLPPLMILKKDGATLYSTRDLATDRFRLFEKYGKDVLIINEVGAEQSLYFQQLYKLEGMLGWVKPGQRINIKHGLFRFKEEKMSTRKGNVIWLEDVLEEAKKRARQLSKDSEHSASQNDRTLADQKTQNFRSSGYLIHRRSEFSESSEMVGIGALKWNDLKRSSEQDITFDWDDILNMQGNSGPYLQYTYARTQSVLRKSPQPPLPKGGATFVSPLYVKGVSRRTGDLNAEERELLRLLVQFPEIVQSAAERYAPSILCTYLFDLAQAFNLFYQKHSILKAEGTIKNVRLLLTEKTGEIIKQGLYLLGIQTPEKM